MLLDCLKLNTDGKNGQAIPNHMDRPTHLPSSDSSDGHVQLHDIIKCQLIISAHNKYNERP